MRKFVVIIGVVVTVLIVILLGNDMQIEWTNVFEGFVAGSIIALMFSYFLPRELARFKKPKDVSFYFRGGDRGTELRLTKIEGGGWQGTLRLRIQNDGRSVLKPYYWKLIFPAEINPEFVPIPNIERTEDGKWLWTGGVILDPIFPDSSFTFPYQLKVKVSRPGEWFIHYFFNTEFGRFPSTAKFFEKDTEKAINNGYLGRLTIIAK